MDGKRFFDNLPHMWLEFMARFAYRCWASYELGTCQEHASINPPPEQLKSLLDGVANYLLYLPHIVTPEENHENWMRWRKNAGYVLGPVAWKKETPSLVMYQLLPEREKLKNIVFLEAMAVSLEMVDVLRGSQ